jgi:ubiquinone/menaquinone biosynthesis C-methylase UbiE
MQEEYELSTEYLELESDSTVLDLACGTANFTRYFAEQLHQSEDGGRDSLVAGMDISWSMLEKARTLLTQQGLDQEVYLIRGDATRIPVQRAAYNRIHCAGALHMVNNIDEALRNFSRVLEPGGICVIGTFLLGDGMVRRFLKKAAEIPSKFHWFSEQELYKRLDRAGFEVADSSVAGDAITVKARRVK